MGIVYKTLDTVKVYIGLFIDLTKVFDMVNHDVFIWKFDAYGIRGIAYQWFVSYLKKQKTGGKNWLSWCNNW